MKLALAIAFSMGSTPINVSLSNNALMESNFGKMSFFNLMLTCMFSSIRIVGKSNDESEEAII